MHDVNAIKCLYRIEPWTNWLTKVIFTFNLNESKTQTKMKENGSLQRAEVSEFAVKCFETCHFPERATPLLFLRTRPWERSSLFIFDLKLFQINQDFIRVGFEASCSGYEILLPLHPRYLLNRLTQNFERDSMHFGGIKMSTRN